MNNQLLQSLSAFMDQADHAYQSDQYEHLNKAFKHLNKLYEELADKTDVEELAEEVIQDRKTKDLMKILDEVQERKLAIKNIIFDNALSKDLTIAHQEQIIRLLQSYILIDSNIA